MTISKLASDVAENHWETKGMKHALQAERDYNLMTTQKLERLKVKKRLLTWMERMSFRSSLLNTAFARVLKNWESPGILLWYFLGLESPRKKAAGPGKFWKSVKTRVKNMICMADIRENSNIEILGV